MCAGLGHAAVLYDRKQGVQITQGDTPADPAIPVRSFGH
jgi:hypothetical protein